MPKEKIRVKASINKIDSEYIYLLPYSEKFDDCGSCDSLLCDKKSKVKRVPFKEGFNVGDDVYIISDGGAVLKYALMIYGIPVLVIFLLSFLFSFVIGLSDMIVAIMAVISLPITYYTIRYLYKDGCYNISIEKID